MVRNACRESVGSRLARKIKTRHQLMRRLSQLLLAPKEISGSRELPEAGSSKLISNCLQKCDSFAH